MNSVELWELLIICFDIKFKIEDYCECPDVPKCSEAEPHMFRVGWSVIESSMQLGNYKNNNSRLFVQ